MKIGLVIPHHLPTLDFLNEWNELRRYDLKLYIVEDKDKRETSTPENLTNFVIYTHKDIKEDLGKDSWIIPFKTSAIRSYGYLKAYQDGCDVIMTLDNDCFPEKDNYWVNGHLFNLSLMTTLGWVSSIPEANTPTRGFPYLIRDKSPVMLSHGLWSNVPDFDGIDMLKTPNLRFNRCINGKIIPKNNYYPMCFTPDNLISIEDGTVKKIKDINIGDKIITDKREIHEVLRKTSKFIDEDICQLTVCGRINLITTTKQHKILTKIGWKNAEDIKSGDLLCIPIKNNNENYLTDQEMYIIGLFIAEGSFHKNKNMKSELKHNGICFSFCIDENDSYVKDVEEFMKLKFNKNGKKYIIKNSIRLEYYGKELASWFYKYTGEYAYNKKIDLSIFNSKNIKELIKGLFFGDGNYGLNHNRPITSFHTISYNLANQTKTILNRLGYYCSLNEYKPKNRIWKQYKITLYGENSSRFNKEILCINKKYITKMKEKAKNYKIGDKYIYVKVIKNEFVKYCGEVFDLTVKDNHSYLVNDCVVHNCGMNLAWNREITPLMYFGIFGPDWGLDQYDDIWAGVFSKKVLDHLNYGVISGYPSVEHRKQSNAFINLQKQAPGLLLNEELWQMIDRIQLTKDNPIDCYKELLDKIQIETKTEKKDYLLKYIEATKIWLSKF